MGLQPVGGVALAVGLAAAPALIQRPVIAVAVTAAAALVMKRVVWLIILALYEATVLVGAPWPASCYVAIVCYAILTMAANRNTDFGRTIVSQKGRRTLPVRTLILVLAQGSIVGVFCGAAAVQIDHTRIYDGAIYLHFPEVSRSLLLVGAIVSAGLNTIGEELV